jgi:hypothetical protein
MKYTKPYFVFMYRFETRYLRALVRKENKLNVLEDMFWRINLELTGRK